MDNWSDSSGSFFVLRPSTCRIKEKIRLEIKLRRQPRSKNTSLKTFKSIMSSQKRN